MRQSKHSSALRTLPNSLHLTKGSPPTTTPNLNGQTPKSFRSTAPPPIALIHPRIEMRGFLIDIL